MNLSILPVKYTTPQKNFNNNCQKNYNRYPNLQPLTKDTVSFGSGIKMMGSRTDAISHAVAKELEAEAEPAMKYLLHTLNKALSQLKATNANPDRPIAAIRCRIKDNDSICEKTASKLLSSKSEIKDDMGDIIGARIVLRDASQKSVDAVIKKLIEVAKSNELKIFEIENYRPEEKYDYASKKVLTELSSVCNKLRSNGVKRSDESYPSGYMAIHFSTYLPDGFKGEIQLMGIDIEKVKDIEDFIYKIKNGKSLKKQYKPIETKLSALRDNKELQRAVNAYTQDLYISARLREPRKFGSRDFKFKDVPNYLPPYFDFNDLQKLKIECEKDYAAKLAKETHLKAAGIKKAPKVKHD